MRRRLASRSGVELHAPELAMLAQLGSVARWFTRRRASSGGYGTRLIDPEEKAGGWAAADSNRRYHRYFAGRCGNSWAVALRLTISSLTEFCAAVGKKGAICCSFPAEQRSAISIWRARVEGTRVTIT